MKKIISGLLGIMMVSAVVGGTAYALFTDSATVSGIKVTAGTAEILVENQPNLVANLAETVYPGYAQSTDFDLKNNSTSGVNMNITAQLTSANGWATSPDLRNAVQVRVGGGTWYTLQQWNDAARALPGGVLNAGDTRNYTVDMRVLSSVGNEIIGEELSNITFTIAGTQVAP